MSFYRTARLTENFITDETEDFEDRKWIWERYGTAHFCLQSVCCCFPCLKVSGASPTMHAHDKHKHALDMPNCFTCWWKTKERLLAELLCKFPCRGALFPFVSACQRDAAPAPTPQIESHMVLVETQGILRYAIPRQVK